MTVGTGRASTLKHCKHAGEFSAAGTGSASAARTKWGKKRSFDSSRSAPVPLLRPHKAVTVKGATAATAGTMSDTQQKTMKAAMFYGAGDIRIEDVEVPKPAEGQVLVKVAWCVSRDPGHRDLYQAHSSLQQVRNLRYRCGLWNRPRAVLFLVPHIRN